MLRQRHDHLSWQYVYFLKKYLVFLFLTRCFEGQLQSSEEGRMEWVEMDKLDTYETVSDLKELLEVMLREDLNEFQYILQGNDWIVNLR